MTGDAAFFHVTRRGESREMFVEADISDVDSMSARYESQKTLRPQAVSIKYRWSPVDRWHISKVTIKGVRFKKDGTPGAQQVRESWYSDHDMPEWLADFVRQNMPGGE